MKQVKRYAVFYCAVLLSVIFINNTLYRGMAAGVSFFAIMIIQSVENTRFVDFMQQHCQQEYFEMKNSGFKRAFIWDFVKRNSKKAACEDDALLDSSRRYVFGCYISIAAFIIIFFTAMWLFIHS